MVVHLAAQAVVGLVDDEDHIVLDLSATASIRLEFVSPLDGRSVRVQTVRTGPSRPHRTPPAAQSLGVFLPGLVEVTNGKDLVMPGTSGRRCIKHNLP